VAEVEVSVGVHDRRRRPSPYSGCRRSFADSARAAGIEYASLVQRIVDLGLRFEPSRLG